MSSQNQTNKETTLAEALEKIETLSAENTKLVADLEVSNTRNKDLQDKLDAESKAHASTKESLANLEANHRDIDKEVSIKVAQVASQSGVEPIANSNASAQEESLEELAKKIENASGIEKAKLVEANAERIIRTLRGVV